jgi:hypothetical protein
MLLAGPVDAAQATAVGADPEPPSLVREKCEDASHGHAVALLKELETIA